MVERIRFVSLNCSTLSSDKNQTLLADFLRRSISCSIILLQETRLTQEAWEPLLKSPMLKPFHVLFSSAYPSERGVDGGVALLFRSSIFPECPRCRWESPGRALRVIFPLGGLIIDLTNVYFPSGNPQRQREFIDTLKQQFENDPQGTSPSAVHIIGGDFNFVHNPSLDRNNNPATTDAIGNYFNATFTNLVDIFRKRNPTVQQFSFFRGLSNGDRPSLSRLDRFYVHCEFIESVSSFFASSNLPFVDHRPIFLDVPFLVPVQTGPGLPRVRLSFLSHQHLFKFFEEWLVRELNTAPRSQNLLILWWSFFKRRLRNKCLKLNQLAKKENPPMLSRELFQKLSDLWSQVDAGDMTCLPALADALKARTAATKAYAQAHTARHRREYIHAGERPNPIISAALNDRQRTNLPPLKDPATDRLVSSSSHLADLVARHWAPRNPV